MGMYDIALADVTCTGCRQRSSRIQFYLRLGKYRAGLREVALGCVLDGLPKLPVCEVYGYPEDCKNGCMVGAVVRFERGRLVGVRSHDPSVPLAPLPAPHDIRKTSRRRAQDAERGRRELASLRAEYIATHGHAPASESELFAMAVGRDIGRGLSYVSWARRVLVVRPLNTKKVGPYVKVDGRWKREREAA